MLERLEKNLNTKQYFATRHQSRDPEPLKYKETEEEGIQYLYVNRDVSAS